MRWSSGGSSKKHALAPCRHRPPSGPSARIERGCSAGCSPRVPPPTIERRADAGAGAVAVERSSACVVVCPRFEILFGRRAAPVFAVGVGPARTTAVALCATEAASDRHPQTRLRNVARRLGPVAASARVGGRATVALTWPLVGRATVRPPRIVHVDGVARFGVDEVGMGRRGRDERCKKRLHFRWRSSK